MPTLVPSNNPSQIPSIAPTYQPSNYPTIPFYAPTEYPTNFPTYNSTIFIPTSDPTTPSPTHVPTQVPTRLNCNETSVLFSTRFVLDIDAYWDTEWLFVGIQDNVLIELDNGTTVSTSVEYIIEDDGGENYNVWDGEVATYEKCLSLKNKNLDCFYLAITDDDEDGMGGEVGGESDDSPSRRTNIDVYLGHQLLTKDFWDDGGYWGVEFCLSYVLRANKHTFQKYYTYFEFFLVTFLVCCIVLGVCFLL